VTHQTSKSVVVDLTAAVPLLWLGILSVVTVLVYQEWLGSELDIPLIGPKATLLGNTFQGEFYQEH